MSKIVKVGNFDNDGGSILLDKVRTYILQFIAYRLPQDQNYLTSYEEESFIAAIDMLATLSEKFQIHPGINSSAVQHWREWVLAEFDEAYKYTSDGTVSTWVNERRAVIIAAFEHLERAIKIYEKEV